MAPYGGLQHCRSFCDSWIMSSQGFTIVNMFIVEHPVRADDCMRERVTIEYI